MSARYQGLRRVEPILWDEIPLQRNTQFEAEPECRPREPDPRPAERRGLHVDGPRKQLLETGRTRLLVAGLVFACAFAVLGLRVIDLAVFNGAHNQLAAQRALEPPHSAQRADIVDRNGQVLATTLPTASLYANPRQISDPKGTAAKLSQVLPDLSPSEAAARMARDRVFIWLERGLTPRQQYEVNRLGVPGLYFREEERRFYPQGALTAHLVGYTDVDSKGLGGVEQSFDELLAGSHRPLRLSIDLRVQHALYDELEKAMTEFQAIGAAGIVMDVHTGELLALVSLPGFDPNDRRTASSDARFNRATLGVYEMGSVFKIFSTAAALDSGAVKLSDRFDVTDPIRVARFAVRDFRPKEGELSVPEIFMHSSNIGTVKLAMEAGGEVQQRSLAALGLTSPATLELPEMGTPMLPSPWREINTMTVSYGHGLAVNPIQVTAAVAATVNGGILPTPTVLARDGESAPPGRRVFSEETSEIMRQLMRLVVEHGTGSFAEARGYLVGGKTGTANKPRGGGYDRNARISNFVGAFPMDDPRYVIFAMLDEPEGHAGTFGYSTGGWVAAPVVRRVVERSGSMLGLKPRDDIVVPDEEDHPLLIWAMGEDKELAAR